MNERLRPQIHLRQKRQDECAGDCSNKQIDQRTRDGNANVACRIGVVLPHVFHQGDAADGKQNDGSHGHTVAAGHHRVSQFMQYNTAEDDPNQHQAAHRTGGAHAHRLSEPDKRQQKNKREVDADIHSEQSSRGN